MTCITVCVGFFGFSLGIVASTIFVSALLSGFIFWSLSRLLMYRRGDDTYAMSGARLRAVSTTESIVTLTILACLPRSCNSVY